MKKIALLTFAFLFCIGFLLCASSSSFALKSDDGSTIVETNLLGNLKDDGKGCGVFMIINLVLYVITSGVGILALGGIIFNGIAYATARDNEATVAVVKKRFLGIIIGLALWVSIWAVLSWLLPGSFINSDTCTTVSDAKVAELKAKEAEANKSTVNKKSSGKSSKSSSGRSSSGSSGGTAKGDSKCLKKAAKVVIDAGICEEKTAAERVAKTAELLAWPKGTSSSKWKDRNGNSKKITKWSQVTKGYPRDEFKSAFDEVYPAHFLKNENWRNQKRRYGNGPIIGASCNTFTAVVLCAAGVPSSGSGTDTSMRNLMDSKNYYRVKGKVKRGDVCFRSRDHHWAVVVKGSSSGRYTVAEAGNGSDFFGMIATRGTGHFSSCKFYRVKEN